MKKHSSIFMLLLCIVSLKASDNKPLSVYVVPSMDGHCQSKEWGFSGYDGYNTGFWVDHYTKYLFWAPNRTKIKNILVETPSVPLSPFFTNDLGQYFCQRHLKKALQENADVGIMHATSQGAATALNYLAYNPDKKIKAVVCEGTVVSGNSVIYNYIAGGASWWQYIPGSRYLIPYLAAPFLAYRPGGQQAIKSIDNIADKQIPIIIVHAQEDELSSVNDAKALYYRLRNNGNNAYFIEDASCIEGVKRHREFIKRDSLVRHALYKILAHHNILPQGVEAACSEWFPSEWLDMNQPEAQRIAKIDLNGRIYPGDTQNIGLWDYFIRQDQNIKIEDYQPHHEQFKEHYERLIARERIFPYLDPIVLAASLGACWYTWKHRNSIADNVKFVGSAFWAVCSGRYK